MKNKGLKAECPACGTSYPLSMCGIPEDKVLSADLICSICHYHFSFEVKETKIFGVLLRKTIDVHARLQPNSEPLEFPSKSSA